VSCARPLERSRTLRSRIRMWEIEHATCGFREPQPLAEPCLNQLADPSNSVWAEDHSEVTSFSEYQRVRVVHYITQERLR
jgi:hypothetical protein